MRQYDDITFEHNGLQVRWGKPTGYRCRDAHAATPSKGDIQHVEKFMSSKYRYEWCVPIGYTPEWAAMSDDLVPSPGCGFINAKCLGNDKTEMIMPNEDYEYCTGMLFDRTKMNIIKDHRRYKVPQDGVDGKYLIYGIDEVLLAVATGFLPRSEFTATHPDDYVTMIYQKKCENSHNDIKSADVATYSEYNELAKLRDRSNNSVVENSTMFNLIYLWAKVVNGSVDDAWNGELLPSTDSLVCENLKNTKFPSYVQARHTACKLFFPTHISMSCNWLMKPSTCSIPSGGGADDPLSDSEREDMINKISLVLNLPRDTKLDDPLRVVSEETIRSLINEIIPVLDFDLDVNNFSVVDDEDLADAIVSHMSYFYCHNNSPHT